MVGRRRSRHLRLARERDQADAQALRRVLEERLRRLLRGLEPGRLDVGRLHRPRDVDDEDDSRLVLQHRRLHVRAGEREAERGEREQEEDRRDVTAPGAAGHDPGEHVEVREPDRVAHPAALGEQADPDRRGDGEQREQEIGAVEAHLPPAQTASAWTTARTPSRPVPERTVTTTRPPRTACVAVTLDDERALGGCVGVEADRVRGADEPLARGTALRDALHAARPERHVPDPPDRRLAGRHDRATVGIRPPPPEAGMQPMCGPEARRMRRGADVRGDEDDVARGRDPGIHGRAEGAEEAEVDRAVGQLRVEPADDVALRAGELVLRPAAAALPSRSGRRPTARRPARRPAGPCTRSSRPRGRLRARAPSAASATQHGDARLTGSPS